MTAEELIRMEHKYRTLSNMHLERSTEYKILADDCIRELLEMEGENEQGRTEINRNYKPSQK